MTTLDRPTWTAAELAELHLVCASRPGYWAASGDLDLVSPDTTAAFLRAEDAYEGGELLVGRAGGRAVGFASVLLRHPIDGYPWIGMLMTDAALHGRGHGRAMAAQLHERFADRGAIRLGVLAVNPAALRFWQALGYQEIDLRPDREKGRPTHVMELRLR